MRIALVGFMGTGKSSVGRLLADRLELRFIDTDTEIEKREGKEIPEIFSHSGEDYFRAQEEKMLEEILNCQEDFILSTGGGIVISPVNRKLLLEYTISILLQASPRVILNRISNSDRPLLKEDPLKQIERLLQSRREYYNQFPVKINTDDKTPIEIVSQIITIANAN